jgi:NAD(P)-dependent dehydrogenase (short-subunit alcohol dehydrogenase family)
MSASPENIVVVGASGAIGKAFVQRLSDQYPNAAIHSFSRSEGHSIAYDNEEALAETAARVSKDRPVDWVIVASGILHDGNTRPEKSLKDLSASNFHHLFEVNTVRPALIAKYFLPVLNRERTSIFAALSARVGSISDNRLGGWYAYRASKAALNMIIKNAAIEMGRSNKMAIVVGLHPGTVDSALSKPFQANVPDDRLFSPGYSVKKMLDVMTQLTPEDSGKCFAWDGKEIQP